MRKKITCSSRLTNIIMNLIRPRAVNFITREFPMPVAKPTLHFHNNFIKEPQRNSMLDINKALSLPKVWEYQFLKSDITYCKSEPYYDKYSSTSENSDKGLKLISNIYIFKVFYSFAS